MVTVGAVLVCLKLIPANEMTSSFLGSSNNTVHRRIALQDVGQAVEDRSELSNNVRVDASCYSSIISDKPEYFYLAL